jgi:hypothetical protein
MVEGMWQESKLEGLCREADIDNILKYTQLRICNERDVSNKESLYKEFSSFQLDRFRNSRELTNFVAIVVQDIPNDGYQSAMRKYQIRGNRDGTISVQGMRQRASIWDVTIHGVKFLVFGPYSFRNNIGFDVTDLVERMIYNEMTRIGDHEVFETYAPEPVISKNTAFQHRHQRPSIVLDTVENDYGTSPNMLSQESCEKSDSHQMFDAFFGVDVWKDFP